MQRTPLLVLLLLIPGAVLRAQPGPPVGDEFQVNAYTSGSQLLPAAGIAADGSFVVAWGSGGSAGNDSSGYSVQGRRFDTGGTPLGGDFQVNSYTSSDQLFPSLAVAAKGDFVVAWSSRGSAGGDSLQHQRPGPPLCLRRHSPRRRVPGQRLHHRRPGLSSGGGQPCRRLRGGVAKRRLLRYRRLRLQHPGPALRRRRHPVGPRVPDQLLHRLRAGPAGGGGGGERRFRGGVGERRLLRLRLLFAQRPGPAFPAPIASLPTRSTWVFANAAKEFRREVRRRRTRRRDAKEVSL